MKHKITFFGYNSYVFVYSIVKALKEARSDIEVTAINLKNLQGSLDDVDVSPFDFIVPAPNLLGGVSLKTKPDGNLDVENGMMTILEGGQELSKFNPALYSAEPDLSDMTEVVMNEAYARKYAFLMQDSDVCVMHSLRELWTAGLRHLPKKTKKVICFWGSDLYRSHGVRNYKKQVEALDLADIIVIHSLEMRETVLSKFGRHLLPKIRFGRFGFNINSVEKINRVSQEEIDSFKERFSISKDKTVVCLGYSAAPRTQHMEKLRYINSMNDDYKSKISVVMPMTYNDMSGYTDAVAAMAEQMPFETVIMRDFMTDEEVSVLRKMSDVMVQMPDTDCFSLSMREVMYAGNIVIAGAWLPYGSLRRCGVHYYEAETFSSMTRTLAKVIDNLEDEKNKAAGNCEIMKKHFSTEATIKEWTAIMDELLV